MRIHSEDKSRYLDLELVECSEMHFSSRNVRVVVDCGDVRGQTTAWLYRDDIDLWMRSLEALDQSRRGQARIESMDPENMKLTVSAMDGPGHLLVECELLSRVYVRDRLVALRLAGGFEMDPSGVPELLVGLRDISEGKTS